MRSVGDCGGTRPPCVVVLEQLRPVTLHGDQAAWRGRDDGVVGVFECPDRLASHTSCGVPVARVKGRQSAAMLVRWDSGRCAAGLDQAGCGVGGIREDAIGQALEEEGDRLACGGSRSDGGLRSSSSDALACRAPGDGGQTTPTQPLGQRQEQMSVANQPGCGDER